MSALLTEQEAFGLMQHFTGLTPENQGVAKIKLQAYGADRHANGKPLFPTWDAQQKQQRDDLESWWIENREPANLSLAGDIAPELKPVERRIALLGQLTGTDPKMIAPNPGAWRVRVAQAWGVPDAATDDALFDSEATKQLKKQRDFRYLTQGNGKEDEASKPLNEGALVNHAALQAKDGKSAADGFAAWQAAAKARPEYAAAEGKDLFEIYSGIHAKSAAKFQELKGKAEKIYGILQREMANGQPFADTSEAETLIEGLSPSERAMIGEFVGKQADAAGKVDKGTGQKSGETVGRVFGRLLESQGSSQAVASLTALDSMGGFVAGQSVPAELAGNPAKLIQRQASNAMSAAAGGNPAALELFGERATLTAEQAAAANAEIAKQRRSINARKFLLDVAEGTVDPVKADSLAGRMGLGALNVVSSMASFAMSGGAVLNTIAYVDDERARLENLGVDPKTAAAQSVVVGSAQALLDRVELGLFKRLPKTGNLLGKLTTPSSGVGGAFVKQVLTNSGPAMGLEMGVEAVQQVTPLIVQKTLNALGVDEPSVSWNEIGKEAWATTEEMFFSMLPLALLGAGVGGHADYRAARAMVSDSQALAALGFSEEQIATITAPESTSARVDALQSLWKERTPIVTVARDSSEQAVNDALNSPDSFSQVAAAAGARADLNFADQVTQKRADLAATIADLNDRGMSLTRQQNAAGKAEWVLKDRETGTETSHPNFVSAYTQAKGKIAGLDLDQAEAISTIADFFISQNRDGVKESLTITGEVQSAFDRLANGADEALMAERIRIEERRRGVPEGSLVSATVLGENQTKFNEVVADGVKRLVAASASKVNVGGNVLTAIEEIIEGRQKAMVAADPEGARARGISFVRLAERATGESFLGTKDDAAVTALDLTEAISHVVQAEVLNRRKDGGKFAPVASAVSRGLESLGENSKEALGAKTWLDALKVLFRAIFRTADKLLKAQAEGKLGEDYSTFVDELLGLKEQAAHNQAVVDGLDLTPGPLGSFAIASGGHFYEGGEEAVSQQEAALDHLRFLHGPPIAEMKGDEVPAFAKLKLLAQWVADYWQEKTGGQVSHAFLGSVQLDRRAASDSISHGMSKTKGQAFYLVPDIIERGRLLGRLPLTWGKPEAFVIGAPVKIADSEYVAIVEVRRDVNAQRLYVHEVILKKEKPQQAFYSAAAGSEAKQPHGSPVGALRKFMQDLHSVNDPSQLGDYSKDSISLSIGDVKLMDDPQATQESNQFSQGNSSQESSAVSSPSGETEQGGTAGVRRRLIDKAFKRIAGVQRTRAILGNQMHEVAVSILSEQWDADKRVYLESRLERMEEMIRDGMIHSTHFYDMDGVSFRGDVRFTAEEQYKVREALAPIKEALDFVAVEAPASRQWKDIIAVKNGSERSAVTYSIASADYLQAVAAMLDRAAADPVQRLATFQRAAAQLAGMSRAVRFNDQNAIRNLSRAGLEKERAKLQADRTRELFQAIDNENPHLQEAIFVSAMQNNPLINLISSPVAGGKRFKSRLISAKQLLRQGRTVGGEYDGSADLPGFLFGGKESVDTLAQEAYENGLIKEASADAFWRGIEQALSASSKGREMLAKFKEQRREARDVARAEADAWAEKQAKAQAGIDFERRELGRAMAALDTMLLTFPPEVRQMVGGFTKLADLKGNKARLSFFKDRVEKLEAAMERHLQREYTAQMNRLIEQARPKGAKEKGAKIVGKIGAAAHDWFAMIEPMISMGNEAVAERLNAIELALADQQTAARQQELTTEWSLLHVFGDWRNKSALEMSSAFGDAQTIFETGRTGWVAVMEQRRTEREGLRGQAIDALGGKATRKRQDAGAARRRTKAGAVAAAVGGFARNLLSFRQVLADLFGRGNQIESRYDRASREATRAERAARIGRERQFEQALNSIYGTRNRLQRQRLLFDLVQPVENSGIIFRETTTRDLPIEIDVAERILDGTMGAQEHGLKPYEVTELRWLMDDHLERVVKDLPGARRTVLHLPRVARGKEHNKTLSKAQAMKLWLTYQMDEYKPSLARDGVDGITMEQIEAFLSPADREFMGWMADQYEAGYDALNTPFQRLYGVNLPRVKHYAPGTFQISGNQAVNLPGEQANGGVGAASSGFLRKRKKHTALIDLSNEGGAIADYWQHVTQTEHWIAWAESVDEMKSVFFNRDVNEAVKASAGDSAALSLRTWVDVLENDGVRQSYQNLEMRKWLSAMMNARAKVALGWKVGVWMKQATAAMGSLLDLSAREFATSAARVLQGRAVMRYGDTLNLPVMAQRLASGGSPEVRSVMSGGAGTYFRPGVANEFMTLGMDAINAIDGRFTMFSAAVAYDAHFRSAIAAGLSPEEARRAAADRTDLTLARTAQPVETLDKSLHEISMPTAVKPFFMFMSEARKSLALELVAVTQAMRGQGSWAEAGKVLVVNHFVFGSLTWALGAMWRDLMNDDDDTGDDPAWEMKDWLLAIATGPLSGIPVLGDVFQTLIAKATNKFLPSNEANLLEGNLSELGKGINAMLKDPPQGEEAEHYLKKSGAAVRAMAQMIGGEFAAAGVAANVVEQVWNLGDDFIETESEADNKLLKADDRRKADEKAALAAALDSEIAAVEEIDKEQKKQERRAKRLREIKGQ